MPTTDDEIDALYQLPLTAFTGARNALAKRGGARAAEIKQLAKPTPPAWAVNQLYWQRRPVFDALAKAAEARRSAVVRQLGGKRTDGASIDARYETTLSAAIAAALTFLNTSGDAVTDATSHAVRQTLEAVPSTEIRGRLIRPVEAVGFSLLAGLMAGQGDAVARAPGKVIVMERRGAAGKAKPPDAVAPSSAAGERRAAEIARRAREERRRERAKIQKELDRAVGEEREAGASLAKARQAAERADARIDSLERELLDARRSVGDLREAADRARLRVNATAATRVLLERKMREWDNPSS